METRYENISSRKLSFYKSLTQNSFSPITVEQLANLIQDKENPFGSISDKCSYYLTLLETDERRAKQYKGLNLSAYCPTGLYLRSRNDRKMVEASGLVWIDFDDVEHAPLVRNEVGKIPNCVLAYISISGTGVHALFATSAESTEPDFYGRLWDLVVRGYISNDLKKYIDPASRKLGQLAIPATDIEATVRLEVEVPQIKVPAPKPDSNLALAHKKIGLPNNYKLHSGDYAKRQLRIYNLIDRTSPPDDYPTWIRLLASLKAGEIDEGSADRWSQKGSNYTRKGFKRAWKSLSSYGGISIGTFIWWASSNTRCS